MSSDISPIVLALAAYKKGGAISDDQRRALFQSGFLAHGNDGRAYVTTSGEEALRENALAHVLPG